MGYLDGFGVTIKKWLGPGTDSGRRVTSEYPEETRPKPERFHGRHVLNRYEDGMEKCIGCELCAGVCPARCIYVRGADNDPEDPTSPGERFGFIYEINYLRCIHCDLCVEACPTEAITETKLFEFAFTNRADAIYTKDELVVDDRGRPQQLPWENWDGGFDPAQDTSGWMRATSPGGDADFVGIVGWSGELGYGVRAPEREPDAPEAPDGHGHDDHDHGHDDHGHGHGHDDHEHDDHGHDQAGPAAVERADEPSPAMFDASGDGDAPVPSDVPAPAAEPDEPATMTPAMSPAMFDAPGGGDASASPEAAAPAPPPEPAVPDQPAAVSETVVEPAVAQEAEAEEQAPDPGGPGYFDLPSVEPEPEQAPSRRRFGRRGGRS